MRLWPTENLPGLEPSGRAYILQRSCTNSTALLKYPSSLAGFERKGKEGRKEKEWKGEDKGRKGEEGKQPPSQINAGYGVGRYRVVCCIVMWCYVAR